MSLDSSHYVSGVPSFPVRAPRKKSSTASAAGTVETTLHLGDSHSIASDPSPHAAEASPFWIKYRALELEKSKMGEYKPVTGKATEKHLVLAALEFERRFAQMAEQDFPWVLVATECEEFPGHQNTKNAARALDSWVGSMELFLSKDKCLYIVSLNDQARHGTCVNAMTSAMNAFDTHYDCFFVHADTIQNNVFGMKAPDAALKWLYPAQSELGPMRAPVIVDVHSGKKTIASSLEFLSNYLENRIADYVLYIRAYKKRDDDKFAAVAILWRRGNVGPLAPGEMANFVEAHSFGTGELDERSINAFQHHDYGHLPAVPPGDLFDREDPPRPITLPAAQLLRDVVDQNGQLVLAAGAAPPPGTDLVIDLGKLRTKLNAIARDDSEDDVP
mmetsp:Transcript_29804/g.43959  ORF Transcript_29804/g.43959 Transcript_29804/m.43959 type:complete len:388 (-) Transcript_29804:130-1293(-)